MYATIRFNIYILLRYVLKGQNCGGLVLVGCIKGVSHHEGPTLSYPTGNVTLIDTRLLFHFIAVLILIYVLPIAADISGRRTRNKSRLHDFLHL